MSVNVFGSGKDEENTPMALNKKNSDKNNDDRNNDDRNNGGSRYGKPHQDVSLIEAVGMRGIGNPIGDGTMVASGRLVIESVRRLVDQNPKGAANALRGWIQDTDK